MTKRNAGFAFHVHHDVLVEWCTDYDERVKFIKNNKPPDEIELRLRLFRLIPEDRLPKSLVVARKAYDVAGEAYDVAWKAYDVARKAYDVAWKAYDVARKAYDVARKAYDVARKAYVVARKAYDVAGEARDVAGEAYDVAGEAYDVARKACQPKLTELHKELCPDCPWDGKAIFPEKGGES